MIPQTLALETLQGQSGIIPNRKETLWPPPIHCPLHDGTFDPLIAVFRPISYGKFPRNARLVQLNNVFVLNWLAQAV